MCLFSYVSNTYWTQIFLDNIFLQIYFMTHLLRSKTKWVKWDLLQVNVYKIAILLFIHVVFSTLCSPIFLFMIQWALKKISSDIMPYRSSEKSCHLVSNLQARKALTWEGRRDVERCWFHVDIKDWMFGIISLALKQPSSPLFLKGNSKPKV